MKLRTCALLLVLSGAINLIITAPIYDKETGSIEKGNVNVLENENVLTSDSEAEAKQENAEESVALEPTGSGNMILSQTHTDYDCKYYLSHYISRFMLCCRFSKYVHHLQGISGKRRRGLGIMDIIVRRIGGA